MSDNWSDPVTTAHPLESVRDPLTPGTGAEPVASTQDDGSSTAEAAKEQASQVAGTAQDAGRRTAEEAKEQAQNVGAEAKQQAKDVLRQTRGELRTQAGEQQQRVAGGLRSISAELGQMASSSDRPGPAADVAQQVSSRVDAVADWLDQREPGQVLEDVQQFARQRPGAFLAIAAGAGLLVGRLARGLRDDATDDSDGDTRAATGAGDESRSGGGAHVAAPSTAAPQSDWAAPAGGGAADAGTFPTDRRPDGLPSGVPSGGPAEPVDLDAVEPSRYPR